MAFTDGGAPVPGCGDVAPASATGRAQCAVTFDISGAHAIGAAYSGDHYYDPSNGSLNEDVPALLGKVMPPPP